MSRRLTPGSAAVLITASLAAYSTAVRAYSLLSDRPHMQTGNRHTIRMDSDLPNGPAWTLGAQGTANLPTSAELLRILDRTAQQWNMFSRAQVSLQIQPNAVALLNVNCSATQDVCGIINGIHDVVHGPRPWWMDSTTQALATCFSNWDCDIYIPDTATFTALEEQLDAQGVRVVVGQNSFARVMGHEMGHLLGIAHPEPQGSNCSGTAESPLMCQVPGRKWDHAATDDVNAMRAIHGTSYQLVRMTKATVASNGAMTWSWLPVNPGVTFASAPRIACHGGTNVPDCVIVGTKSCAAGTCVTAMAVGEAGTEWTQTSSTTLANVAKHPVDVAYGSTAGGATMVWLDQGSMHLRWGRWSIANGASVTAQPITHAGGGEQAVSNTPPRIAWHAGIQRCLIVFADRQRNFWGALSTDAACSSFNPANQLVFTAAGPRHAAGQFDLTCPAHHKATGYTTADPCVLAMVEQTSALNGAGPTNAQRQTYLNSQVTTCNFTIGGTPLAVGPLTCATQGWADTMVVGLWDMRFGSPATAAWAMSVSRQFPSVNDNTAQIVSTNSMLPAPATALSIFNTPISGVSRSDWGGLSCDFVEYNSTLACASLEPLSGVAW